MKETISTLQEKKTEIKWVTCSGNLILFCFRITSPFILPVVFLLQNDAELPSCWGDNQNLRIFISSKGFSTHQKHIPLLDSAGCSWRLVSPDLGAKSFPPSQHPTVESTAAGKGQFSEAAISWPAKTDWVNEYSNCPSPASSSPPVLFATSDICRYDFNWRTSL